METPSYESATASKYRAQEKIQAVEANKRIDEIRDPGKIIKGTVSKAARAHSALPAS